MTELLIVPYKSKYKKDLIRLSYEWLEKYVNVEPDPTQLTD